MELIHVVSPVKANIYFEPTFKVYTQKLIDDFADQGGITKLNA